MHLNLPAIPEADPQTTQDLSAMIAACRFRHVAPDIISNNFAIIGPIAGAAKMRAVSQKDLGGQNMTTDEIKAAIARMGYRLATLPELLAYAQAKAGPYIRAFVLDPSCTSPDNNLAAPYLYGGPDSRGLGLRRGITGTTPWLDEHDMFLIVPV